MSSPADAGYPLPFGVRADTGEYLPGLTDDCVEAALSGRAPVTPEALALDQRASAIASDRAWSFDVDPRDLAQAGWGVLYAPSVSLEIKKALAPLLDHRAAVARPFVPFEGVKAIQKNESAYKWLRRQGVGMEEVNPARGVPFYLMLVGTPEEIPFEFQYDLDSYWAVGRLWFETPEEFRRYAESVVAYETLPIPALPEKRQAAMFAPANDYDGATQTFVRQVAEPLVNEFSLESVVGVAATKPAFARLLRGQPGARPALLVSGSHGACFPLADPRQQDNQGAIICQEWSKGNAEVPPEHRFGGSDIPADANLNGLIHFFFACYGGGCPEFDTYDRLSGEPARIAERPFLSRLPQSLLSHPAGGALAVLTHIDRAWSDSFNDGLSRPRIESFRGVIGRLLRGERIGQATDTFNLRWSNFAKDLNTLRDQRDLGVDVSLKELGRVWLRHDDARNYLIIGDPAARLRVRGDP